MGFCFGPFFLFRVGPLFCFASERDLTTPFVHPLQTLFFGPLNPFGLRARNSLILINSGVVFFCRPSDVKPGFRQCAACSMLSSPSFELSFLSYSYPDVVGPPPRGSFHLSNTQPSVSDFPTSGFSFSVQSSISSRVSLSLAERLELFFFFSKGFRKRFFFCVPSLHSKCFPVVLVGFE